MNQLHHLGYFPGVFYYYYWRHNLYATAITYKILIMVCHHYQYAFSSAFQKSRYLSINFILLIALLLLWEFYHISKATMIYIYYFYLFCLTYYFFHLMLFLLPCCWVQFVKILFIHLLKPIYELTKIVSNYIFHIVLWLQNCNMDFFMQLILLLQWKCYFFFPESYINSFSCLQFSMVD